MQSREGSVCQLSFFSFITAIFNLAWIRICGIPEIILLEPVTAAYILFPLW